MKRLDEIPKKVPFEVPEGYFDKLPGRIQARIAKPEPEVVWGKFALRYALPVLVMGAAAVFFLTNRPALSPEEVIASIESEQLVAYLGDSEVNTDDILDVISLEPTEVESIELDALGDFQIDETTADEWVDGYDSVR
jgi:hypothetical protein